MSLPQSPSAAIPRDIDVECTPTPVPVKCAQQNCDSESTQPPLGVDGIEDEQIGLIITSEPATTTTTTTSPTSLPDTTTSTTTTTTTTPTTTGLIITDVEATSPLSTADILSSEPFQQPSQQVDRVDGPIKRSYIAEASPHINPTSSPQTTTTTTTALPSPDDDAKKHSRHDEDSVLDSPFVLLGKKEQSQQQQQPQQQQQQRKPALLNPAIKVLQSPLRNKIRTTSSASLSGLLTSNSASLNRGSLTSASFTSASLTSAPLTSASLNKPQSHNLRNQSMTSSLNNSQLKRSQTLIVQQFKEMVRNPPMGITVAIEDGNIDKWNITMLGPPGTPYENGIFPCSLQFTSEYPTKPPVFRFLTPDFVHPNVFSDGKVCISILHEADDIYHQHEPASEKWRPILGVEQVLVSIMSLLNEPNPNSPANPDVTKLFRHDPEEYRKLVIQMVQRTIQDAEKKK